MTGVWASVSNDEDSLSRLRERSGGGPRPFRVQSAGDCLSAVPRATFPASGGEALTRGKPPLLHPNLAHKRGSEFAFESS